MSLPEYEHPPLNEVALGVQFEPLANLRTVHLGLFWSRIRSRYPFVEDKAPLPHTIEWSEPKPIKEQMTVVDELPLPRCWLLDQTKTNLIQLQRDRFLRNWRQLKGTETYPRYGKLAEYFFKEWQEFLSFAKDEHLAEPTINQCELTYVNHFEPGIGWKDLSDLDSLFSFFNRHVTGETPKGPDWFNWGARYKLAEGKSGGHVKVDTVFRGRDLKMILAMTLTARGAPAEPSSNGLSSWFDMAHQWIVRTFDELTNPTMHKLWGKKS